MIVTCENCDKRFNLDESLIKESGSKVKCSECHHIFTVHKLVPVEEPDSALEEAPADLPVTEETPLPSLQDEEAPEEAAAVSGEAPEEVLDFDLSEGEEEAAEDEISLEEFGLEEELTSEEPFPIEEEDAVQEAPVAAEEAPEEVLDFDLLGAEEEAAEEGVSLEEFGLEEELTSEEPFPIEEEDAVEEATEAAEEAPEEVVDFDLSGAEEEAAEDEISLEEFGLEEEPASEEPSLIEEEVAVEEATVAAEEAPEEVVDFDLSGAEKEAAEDEISLEEFGLEEEPPPIEEEVAVQEATEAAEEAPEEVLDFGLPGAEKEAAEDEILLEEFGIKEEPAAEEPSLTGEEIVFEGAPEAVESLEGAEEGEAEHVEEELMPPPVAEEKPRAKKRISTPLMIMLVLVLLAGGSYGAYNLLQSLDIKIPYLESLIGAPGSETIDPGNLRITTLEQLIKTKFVENSTTGLLLVIKGKVRNDYAEARNFIMVRGVIYSQDGKVVQEKTVYCGNTLSDADLKALDKAAIEKRLRNRFGDKKSNFRVLSGKALPFMVAFADLPQDLGEFSVEVVSSSPG